MTHKQQLAAKNAVENGGNISKAMREAGYSSATAKNPKKLTESVGWNELMEYYLPDELLLSVLADDIKNRPETRRYSLELALKLKRRLDKQADNTFNTSFADTVAREKHKYDI